MVPLLTGPSFGAEEQGPGTAVGTAWGDVGIEEALHQGRRGLLQASGKLSGCLGHFTRYGVDGLERKTGFRGAWGRHSSHEKGTGEMGKKWG